MKNLSHTDLATAVMDGERFMEESIFNPFEVDNGTMRQPDQVHYSLFDDAFKKETVKSGFVVGGLYKHYASKIDNDLERALAEDNLKISNS